jgi:antitoxin component HigA of HigAB toxin-antitoxin module
MLWDATDTASKDRLEVLSILVEAYERVHHAVQAPSAVAAIQFRMEQLGMSRAALGVVVGSRSRATEILSGTRQPRNDSQLASRNEDSTRSVGVAGCNETQI